MDSVLERVTNLEKSLDTIEQTIDRQSDELSQIAIICDKRSEEMRNFTTFSLWLGAYLVYLGAVVVDLGEMDRHSRKRPIVLSNIPPNAIDNFNDPNQSVMVDLREYRTAWTNLLSEIKEMENHDGQFS